MRVCLKAGVSGHFDITAKIMATLCVCAQTRISQAVRLKSFHQH
jgi:hypothetical protein